MENGRRTYHGRRGPAPIVWVIALVVLIAAVVLVVVSLMTKEPPARVQEMVTQLNRKDSEPEKEEAACRTSM